MMTAVAIPAEPGPGAPEAEAPDAGARLRNVAALVVCVLTGALWFAASLALVQGGSAVAISDARGAAPAVPAAVRLQEKAAAMTATEVREISAESAEAINASVPVVDGPNPAATPFSMAAASPADRARSLDCLTAAIYYESANEPTDGQRGVAQVILNRVRHPAYPNTVCGVVFEGAHRTTGCQFSFTCDGSLRRTPVASLWARSRAVAEAALAGYVHRPVGLALNYHANYVVPYWSSSLVKNANVGLHIFYRWRGNNGRPGAFSDRYAGAEPAIAWRGGFGQPLRGSVQTAGAATATPASVAAAEAAIAGRVPPGDPAANASVDSFQRSVLRRYEQPLQAGSANQLITENAERTNPQMSSSQRWALTGNGGASQPQQPPLGRRPPAETRPTPPSELQGVRYRPNSGGPTSGGPTNAGNDTSGR